MGKKLTKRSDRTTTPPPQVRAGGSGAQARAPEHAPVRARASTGARPSKGRQGSTTGEAAAHFAVTEDTIREWERAKRVVRFPDRSIDLVATAALAEPPPSESRAAAPDRASTPESALTDPRAFARVRPAAKRSGATTREAAQHFGVSEESIRQWGKKGWLVRGADRRIDLEATAVKVEQDRDPSIGGKADRGIGPKPTTVTREATNPLSADERDLLAAQAEPDDVDQRPVPEGMTLHDARLRREYWGAVKAEIEARQLRGELVPIEVSRKVYVDVIGTAKANLEAVEVRVAPLLVGMQDQRRIRAIVGDEIRAALRSVPDEPPRLG